MVTGPNGFKKEITTDSKGIASLNNIEWGTYNVQEIKAPEGYNLNSVAQEVEVSKFTVGQPQKLIFKDSKMLGSLVITKIGNDGAKLSGAEFTVEGPNGYKQVVTTDKAGVATLNNIPWGTYTVRETKAPIGYELSGKEQTITINADNVSNVQNLTFSDKKILGSLVITKTDEEGNVLSGAEFIVTGPNGFKKEVTTDSKGIASLNNIEWGTYKVQEIKAPEGYNLNSLAQKVEVSKFTVGKPQKLIFKDTKILGSLVITKEGSDKEKLAGATFEITGPNNFNKTVVTGKDGTVSIDGLAWGSYEIKETKAPEGYNLNNEIKVIKINSKNAGEVQRVIVKDDKIIEPIVPKEDKPSEGNEIIPKEDKPSEGNEIIPKEDKPSENNEIVPKEDNPVENNNIKPSENKPVENDKVTQKESSSTEINIIPKEVKQSSDNSDKQNEKSQDYKKDNPRSNNPLTGENGQMIVVLVILAAAIILLILNNTKFKKRKN